MLSLFLFSALPLIVHFGFFTFQAEYPERLLKRVIQFSWWATLAAFVNLVWHHYWAGPESFHLQWSWFQHEDYSINLGFRVNAFALWFSALVLFLIGIVQHFSFEFLSREKGVYRFFSLISVLKIGLLWVSFADRLDVIAIGWEWVGVSSVFLIGFFHRHEVGARSSIYALINYKVGDAFLLTAIALLHHETQSTLLTLNPEQGLAIGLCMIFAAAPKSAQFPFSGWIKRSIEGPSSSTAIFYGALSIHLGPYLLIQSQNFWSPHLILRGLILCIGFFTALYTYHQSITRSDAKSALVCASQSQVGLIWVEIALGLYSLALIHMIGHALLRSWQFLRASSALHDFLDNPIFYQEIRGERKKDVDPNTFLRWWTGFGVEKKIELAIGRTVELLRGKKLNIKLQLGIVFGNALFSFILAKSGFDPLIYSACLLVITSLQAFVSRSLLDSFILVGAVQILQFWLAFVCTDEGADVIRLAFISEGIILFIFGYLIYGIHRKVDLNRPREFFGLYELIPHRFAYLTFLSMMLAGIAPSLSFFTEDLAFHAYLSHSKVGTFLVIFTIGLNSAAITRNVFRMFWGSPEDGLTIPKISIWDRWVLTVLILGFIVIGLFPGLLQVFGFH